MYNDVCEISNPLMPLYFFQRTLLFQLFWNQIPNVTNCLVYSRICTNTNINYAALPTVKLDHVAGPLKGDWLLWIARVTFMIFP